MAWLWTSVSSSEDKRVEGGHPESPGAKSGLWGLVRDTAIQAASQTCWLRTYRQFLCTFKFKKHCPQRSLLEKLKCGTFEQHPQRLEKPVARSFHPLLVRALFLAGDSLQALHGAGVGNGVTPTSSGQAPLLVWLFRLLFSSGYSEWVWLF